MKTTLESEFQVEQYQDGVCLGSSATMSKTEIDSDSRDCTIVTVQYKNDDCTFPSSSNAATYFEMDLEVIHFSLLCSFHRAYFTSDVIFIIISVEYQALHF